MANTYTKIYVHFVFAVQHRQCLIKKAWKDELYRYINATITNKGHKLYAIGGMADHLHLLVSMNPDQSMSSFIADVKRSSAMWINQMFLRPGIFAWQRGFGAFTYSKNDVHNVANYIENQEEHHKKQNFHDEYIKFLNDHNIEYDERFVFRQVEKN